MDGKGRCMDNIFIERLWRSLKYEEVYLNAYGTVAEAKAGIGSWVSFYKGERLQQALGYRTPAEVHAGIPGAMDMTLRLRQSLDNATALPTYPQLTTTGFLLSRQKRLSKQPRPPQIGARAIVGLRPPANLIGGAWMPTMPTAPRG